MSRVQTLFLCVYSAASKGKGNCLSIYEAEIIMMYGACLWELARVFYKEQYAEVQDLKQKGLSFAFTNWTN